VFPVVGDPVGAGFVDSLARPGGNVTGFMNFEYGISGKWLELLKEIAPGVTRVAVLRDAAIPTGIAACCARTASGHAAAPPRSVMNLRRAITRSPRRRSPAAPSAR
jgi:ABC transporter substrate binding protein